MKRGKITRAIINWLKYRKVRRVQAARAASLAVQLVMNGCLAPPRLNGAKGRVEKPVRITSGRFQAIIGRGGVA